MNINIVPLAALVDVLTTGKVPLELPTEMSQHLDMMSHLIELIDNKPVFDEMDYELLVSLLNRLIDIVKENETHTLAPLMNFIGTLIKVYEDEHVPEITEI